MAREESRDWRQRARCTGRGSALKIGNYSASPISDLLPPLLGEGGGGGSSGAVFAKRRRHTDPHPHLGVGARGTRLFAPSSAAQAALEPRVSAPKAGRRKTGSRGTASQSDLSSYKNWLFLALSPGGTCPSSYYINSRLLVLSQTGFGNR